VSVSASRYWITPSLPERFKNWPLERVVLSLIPQVGGQHNEIRYEVIAAAFSSSFALKSRDAWITVFGAPAEDAARPMLNLQWPCSNPQLAGFGR
jgi:hypothetical protein